MPLWLNRYDVKVLAAAYELDRRAVIADVRVLRNWDAPNDDLVVWLSRRHGWNAELTVSYLTMIRTMQIEHIRADL